MQNAILSGASLKEQILKFHGQSVKNGFYDDYPKESRSSEEYICSRAMLISGEIAEAYEAYRSGKIDASVEILNEVKDSASMTLFATVYSARVKGTVAEELADTYIRLCCVAGSVEIYGAPDLAQELAILKGETKNSGIHALFHKASRGIDIGSYNAICSGEIAVSLAHVYLLADYLKIDLHRHVELKHLYNTTREYKHGKNY
jgi:NTP pyrophosphatase (non-canonical NTP hydrolase)